MQPNSEREEWTTTTTILLYIALTTAQQHNCITAHCTFHIHIYGAHALFYSPPHSLSLNIKILTIRIYYYRDCWALLCSPGSVRASDSEKICMLWIFVTPKSFCCCVARLLVQIEAISPNKTFYLFSATFCWNLLFVLHNMAYCLLKLVVFGRLASRRRPLMGFAVRRWQCAWMCIILKFGFKLCHLDYTHT